MHECPACGKTRKTSKGMASHIIREHLTKEYLSTNYGGIDEMPILVFCWCPHSFWGGNFRCLRDVVDKYDKHLRNSGGAIAHFLAVHLGVYDRSKNHDRA